MKSTSEILMVDDNPADIDLTSEVLAQSEGRFHMNAVNDGVEAISFLRHEGKYAKAPVPDLVVLDLNLPRKDGCEVLSNIKADPALSQDSSREFSRLRRRIATSAAVTNWEPTAICENRAILRNSWQWFNPWRSSGSVLPALPQKEKR